MCAPAVLESVERDMSRRGFIGAVAACAAAGSSAALAQSAVRMPKGFRDVLDLTHLFSPALPVYPGYKALSVRERFSVARDGFSANEVTFDEHTGTHVDAPSHFFASGVPAERLEPGRLVAPLAVISLVDRAMRDPDTLLSVDDVLEWEKRHGRLPAGAFLAMSAGWDSRAASPDRFLNRDSKGVMHAPGFSEAAARFLVERARHFRSGSGYAEPRWRIGAEIRRAHRHSRSGEIRSGAAGQSRPRPSLGRHGRRRCAETRRRDRRSGKNSGTRVSACQLPGYRLLASVLACYG